MVTKLFESCRAHIGELNKGLEEKGKQGREGLREGNDSERTENNRNPHYRTNVFGCADILLQLKYLVSRILFAKIGFLL